MPKIVDHDQRKRQIAEAACAIIAADGVQQATVRNIARRAGMSAGAVRHYFPTQAALLDHALDLVKQRVTARIVAIQNRAYPPREMVIRLLLELIPLDPDTSLEMQVWFGYIYSGYFADGFPDGPKDELRQGMSRVFRLLDHYGLLRPDLDVSLESEVLYALVDGLALHAMLEPARIGREQAARVLNRYLDTICLPET